MWKNLGENWLVRNIWLAARFAMCCAAFVFICGLFMGCSGLMQGGGTSASGGRASDGHKWTVLVYMSADNDLEDEALIDVKEMESVNFGKNNCDVLVLLDRPSSHISSSNGNWSDTRLYKIAYDKNGISSEFVSKEIDCPELQIKAGVGAEQDMANGHTLRRFVNFAKRVYPADYYALIMWGHGSGWSGLCYDKTSDVHMTTSDFSSALSSLRFDVVAFDTCFGAVIENVYELSGKAKWLVGSASAVPVGGWNYYELFNNFMGNGAASMTPDFFCDCVIRQFKNEYANANEIAISKIDLDKISDVEKKFDEFSASLAATISSASRRDYIHKIMANDVTSYHATQYPADKYLEIYDLAEKFSDEAEYGKDVAEKSLSLKKSLEDCVVESWGKSSMKKNGSQFSLSVNFIPMMGANVNNPTHDKLYIRGGKEMVQCAFVNNCEGYVPAADTNFCSLLNKLFYCKYD